MKQFIGDSAFWQIFPDAQIFGIVVVGVSNQTTAPQMQRDQQLLTTAEQQAQQYLTAATFSDNTVIQEWRQAYRQFKKKRGARSSIEALLKRVSQGKELYPINPLVDLYNSISLQFGVPTGGEDLAQITGDLHLGVAQGGENFQPLGVDHEEPAQAGEVIYYDDLGAICRCLNWREAQRTMLTESTTTAILMVEAINQRQQEFAQAAILQLQQLIAQELQVTGTSFQITAKKPQVDLL